MEEHVNVFASLVYWTPHIGFNLYLNKFCILNTIMYAMTEAMGFTAFVTCSILEPLRGWQSPLFKYALMIRDDVSSLLHIHWDDAAILEYLWFLLLPSLLWHILINKRKYPIVAVTNKFLLAIRFRYCYEDFFYSIYSDWVALQSYNGVHNGFHLSGTKWRFE